MANEVNAIADNYTEVSQGSISNTSGRLPVSLTTPDCSILFERSLTSDQPSIAQTRRQLNLLQTLAGSFGGCENSRTACEDTQDRSLGTHFNINYNMDNTSRSAGGFGGRSVTFADMDSNKPSTILSSNMHVNNDIPALFDEDASTAPTVNIAIDSTNKADSQDQQDFDSQRNKSDDFNIPNNLTLGDYFKMTDGQNGVGGGGDEANHAFSTNTQEKLDADAVEEAEIVSSGIVTAQEPAAEGKEELGVKGKNNSGGAQLHNHMIEIEKFAEGWTRHEESAITIGELYLAFKCPEKIVLEYSFEQYTFSKTNQLSLVCPERQQVDSHQMSNRITVIPNPPSDDSMIFKLLTAASLSLAHLEQQKQEQQNKLQQEQPASKMKRRKGNSNNPNTIKKLTSHDIERTNQQVVEALKQLQPTKLRVYRRAR